MQHNRRGSFEDHIYNAGTNGGLVRNNHGPKETGNLSGVTATVEETDARQHKLFGGLTNKARHAGCECVTERHNCG